MLEGTTISSGTNALIKLEEIITYEDCLAQIERSKKEIENLYFSTLSNLTRINNFPGENMLSPHQKIVASYEKCIDFLERIGEQVAAKGVTVIDEGCIPDRRGSRLMMRERLHHVQC